jgi:predicted Zn-dependent protease
MGLLDKLLGKRSADEEQKRAEELLARGEVGLAKLAYERALSAAGAEPDDRRRSLQDRVDACCDQLARTRMAEGDRLLSEGAFELALREFEAAIEAAHDRALALEAEQRIENAQRRDAREQAAALASEPSEDERFELIAATWEDAQLDEYDACGPELRAALLALYNGETQGVRPVLERLLNEAEPPCYLAYEVGRVRLLEGDSEGGKQALERFVDALAPDEGGESRLVAHMELATLLHDKGELDAAMAQYEAAVDALPDDPRPYSALAAYLVREGAPAEAVELLNDAIGTLEQDGQRQWRLSLDLGLAHAALGENERAIELLEGVVSYLAARTGMDLPPECAVPLAELHEKTGNPTRALDLYNVLAAGSDARNRYTYHRQAARLLRELGHVNDARRMLQRASELAPADPAVRADLERELAELR